MPFLLNSIVRQRRHFRQEYPAFLTRFLISLLPLMVSRLFTPSSRLQSSIQWEAKGRRFSTPWLVIPIICIRLYFLLSPKLESIVSFLFLSMISFLDCILETSPSIYVGLDDGIFTYQDKKIMVDHGYILIPKRFNIRTIYDLHSNQYIEGSTLSMNIVFRDFLAILSLPIEFAIHCASVNPSKLLQLTHKKGTLDNGLDADMVFLDSNFNVVSTYIQGKQVYRIPYMAE